MPQLSLIDKAFLLKKTELFGHLDLDLLLTVADRLSPIAYEKGASIFHRGRSGRRLYVVVTGHISIRSADGDIAQLGRHEFFGEEPLFNEQARGYSAICLEDSTLLSLSRSDLFAIIQETPSVAIALLKAYASGTDFRHRHLARELH